MPFVVSLSAEQEQRVRRAGVNLAAFDSAWLVFDEQLPLFMTTLDVELENSEPYPGYPDLTNPTFRTRQGTPVPVAANSNIEVLYQDWRGTASQQRAITAVIERALLPKLPATEFGKVLVRCMAGQPLAADEIASDTLAILIYSAGGGDSLSPAPATVFGEKVALKSGCFTPSGDGHPIFDSLLFPAGELVHDNVVYVHFDLLAVGFPAAANILQKLLEEVIELRKLDEGGRTSHIDQRLQAGYASHRSAYVTACANTVETKAAAAEKALVTGQQAVEKLQQALTQAVREQAENERKLAALRALQTDQRQARSLEFDRMAELPEVKGLRVGSKNQLIVLTHLIHASVRGREGEVREVGEMRIEFYPEASDPDKRVYIWNLTRRVQIFSPAEDKFLMNAPHVNGYGQPCLGTLQEALPKLIAEYQLLAALVMIIRSLQQIDPVAVNGGLDRFGAEFDKWPKKAS